MLEITKKELIVKPTWEDGPQFSGIGPCQPIYHPPTGQTVIVACLRPDGEDYSLWYFIVNDGAVTEPVQLSPDSWSVHRDFRLFHDIGTGEILVASDRMDVVRLAVSPGNVTLVKRQGFRSTGDPARVHPTDESVLVSPSYNGLCFTSINDFYVIDNKDYNSLVMRRYIWTGSEYVVSTDADIVMDPFRPNQGFRLSAQYDQVSSRFFLSSSRFSGGLTQYWTGFGAPGSLHPGDPTVYHNSLSIVDARMTDPSAAAGVVVWSEVKDEYDYHLFHGLASEGVLAVGGMLPWSEGQVYDVGNIATSPTAIGFTYQTWYTGTTWVAFVGHDSQSLQDPVRLAQTGQYSRGGVTFNQADNAFHATVFENAWGTEKGLYLATISPPIPQFWTNFVGQSERVV